MSEPNPEAAPLQKKVLTLAEQSYIGSIALIIIGVVVGGILLCVAASNVIDDKPEPYVQILGLKWPDSTTRFSIQFMGFYFLSVALLYYFRAIWAKQLKLATLQKDCAKLEIISFLMLGLSLIEQMGIICSVWYYWILLSIPAIIYCAMDVGACAVWDTRGFKLIQNCIAECRVQSTEFVAVET